MSSSLASIGVRCAEVQFALSAYTPENQSSLERIHSELTNLKAEVHFYQQISPNEVGISLYSKMISSFEEMVDALPKKTSDEPRWGMIASDPILRQMHADFSREFDPEIVDKCFRYCAFLRHLDLNGGQSICSSSTSPSGLPYDAIREELRFRIEKIAEFTFHILRLFEEIRPKLPGSAETYRMVQGVAFSIYRYPLFYTQLPPDNSERMRVENLIGFMIELNASPMKDEDISYLLKVGVNQFVQTVSSQEIEQGARLSQMHRRATYSYRARSLVRATVYTETHKDKRMYLIQDEDGIPIGKLKTFVPGVYHYNCHRNEALGYAYDQLLGAGMTCPTKIAPIFPCYESEVINEFWQITEALRSDQQVGKDQFAQLSDAIKNAVYRCLDQLKHSSTSVSHRGLEAFWNEKGYTSTPEERAQAVEVFVELWRIAQSFRSIQTMVAPREGRDRAAKVQFAKLPPSVKNAIYGCLYQVKNPEVSWLNYGEEAFRGMNGLSSTPQERAQAIEMYLGSDFPEISPRQSGSNSGIIQLWAKSGNAMELLSEEPDVGASLRDVSVAMAHRYAVLGWVKGSKDGHVANTLLQFDSSSPRTSASSTSQAPASAKRLSNFLDCDDEFLLGANLAFGNDENNNLPLWQFGFLRMWQMGLPQSAVPFSRVELFLIANSNLSQKVAQLNRNSRWIRPADLEEQRLRVDALEKRAKEALREGTTFSMRDLYHEVVVDADKVAEVATRFPPIQAYDLPRLPDWCESFKTPTFAQNMQDLYQLD